MNAQGQPVEYVDPNVYLNQQSFSVLVQAPLAPGPATVTVELCDCNACEAIPGSGRCIKVDIPVVYAPPGSDLSDAVSRPGPDRR